MLLCVFFQHTVGAQIAPGVQQSAAQTATVTGTVVRSDGTPVIGADVQLIGSAVLSTKSDAHGVFDFTGVPYGVYKIVAIVATLGMASRENLAVRGDITAVIQYVAQSNTSRLKEIARVSTRSSGASINVTPASIASISPSDYAFQGNTSWRELLDRIPGVTVGGYLEGGQNGAQAIPEGPFNPITISINGALPYETSVTLDGMPLANSSISVSSCVGSGVDLSYLPMSTFDTADVVRGPGADAPSIVDSIGGSFVLHAPGQVDHNQFELSVSNDPYGGIVSNARAKLRLGRLSATIAYGANNSPGPFGSQNVIPGFTSTPSMVNSQFVLNGGFAGFISNPNYLNSTYQIRDSLLYCCVSFGTAWTQHNGAIALSYAITPSITAQIFYTGSSSLMQQPGNEFSVDFTPAAGYSGSISPGASNRYIYVFGQGATIKQASSLLEEKLTAYLGRGVVRLAALQNNSFDQEFAPLEPTNGQYTLWGSATYCNNPPSCSSSTPAIFNGTTESLTFSPFDYDTESWTNNRDLLASYATQLGSRMSLGASYVTSYYNAPSWFRYPQINFGRSQSSAVSERTNEVRVHAGAEVSDRLSLDVSWYTAQGTYHVINPASPTTWTDSVFPYSAPRFGAVWHTSRDIAIRAAAGGGYALPPLNYLIGTNGAPSCGTYCAITLTNVNLTPERSFGFDLGTDIRFHHDTVLSLDFYHTNLYGQFFQATNLTGTYTGLPLYTTQYNNLAQSRFEGVNIDIRHDVSKGLYWHGALGLTRAYAVSVPAGFYDSPVTGPSSVNTYIVPGINFDGQFQSTVPYANGTAQLGYRWSPEKYVDLSPTYYGNNNSYFRPAFLEFDAHVGYSLTKNISLLATFRNITGIYGQNYQYISSDSIVGAPTVAGIPYALFGMPFGPRSLIVTAYFKY